MDKDKASQELLSIGMRLTEIRQAKTAIDQEAASKKAPLDDEMHDLLGRHQEIVNELAAGDKHTKPVEKPAPVAEKSAAPAKK